MSTTIALVSQWKSFLDSNSSSKTYVPYSSTVLMGMPLGAQKPLGALMVDQCSGSLSLEMIVNEPKAFQ